MNLILILLFCMLLTVNTAASEPSSLIKDGVRIYAASSYHAKAPLSVCINKPESHQALNEVNSLSDTPKDFESGKNNQLSTQPEDQEDNPMSSKSCNSGDGWKWIDSFFP